MISLDKIDNDVENPKWCDSCGKVELEIYRLTYGTGLPEGSTIEHFCLECTIELSIEIDVALEL